MVLNPANLSHHCSRRREEADEAINLLELPGCSIFGCIFWLAQAFCLCPLQAAAAFRLVTRPLLIPERGPVPSYVLQSGQQRFSFLAPPQWKVNENAPSNEVVIMAPSLTTSISFKISDAVPPSTPQEILEQWRKAILESYPGAKITAEFPCYTSNVAGTAFDLERSSANKGKVSTRLALIPLPHGRIEFNLTTPKGKLVENYFAFANLLTSFHIEPEAAR